MKRKRLAPRNPFVAAAKFRKAGAHGKSEKALRRVGKIEMGMLARRSSSRLLTDRQGFDSLTSHPPQKVSFDAHERARCMRLTVNQERAWFNSKVRSKADLRGQQRAAEILCKDLV